MIFGLGFGIMSVRSDSGFDHIWRSSMKGFLFVDGDCPNAAFWLTENGSVSRKYHPELIGCVVLDSDCDPELLIRMILTTKPSAGKFTADWLNSIG